MTESGDCLCERLVRAIEMECERDIRFLVGSTRRGAEAKARHTAEGGYGMGSWFLRLCAGELADGALSRVAGGLGGSHEHSVT